MRSVLGSKLTATFGLLSLLPLVCIGVVAVYGLRLSHEQDIAAMERALLRQKQEETQKFFDSVVELFDIRVGYDSLSVISDSDQKFLLDKLLQENKYINEAAFVDMTGMETAKVSRLQDAALMGLNSVRDLPKFDAIKKGDVRYLGPVHQTLLGPMMTVAAPVTNRSGQVIMVLTGEVSLVPLKNLFALATLGNAGYAYETDNAGNVIAGSDNRLPGMNLAHFSDIKKSVSAKAGVLETRPGLLSSSVLAMSSPIKGLNWITVAEWPVGDAYESISTLRTQFIWFAFAVFGLVIIVGWMVGWRILRPLSELASGAKKFGSGDLKYEIKVNTGDELEDLGRVMNKMAGDVRSHMEALDESHKKIEEHLQEITKLKDDFIFVAAHELRSPVTALQGYVSEILDDKKTEAKLKKMNPYFVDMVRGIEVSKDRLSALVDDLLNIARMEAGKFKINIREGVDIATSVAPILETMKELCKPRKITLSCKTVGKIPKLKIDPDRVNEILTNLISNAIKYNKDKGTIKVQASFEDQFIWLEVADSGIGLNEQEQQHLFEKFWRSDDVSKLQGTGLGLFIVKHMLEQMGGTISCTSQKGRGTTFRFGLPAT